MGFDWNSFDAVEINVASWPLDGSRASGQVRTAWELRTLHDLPKAAEALLGQADWDRLSPDMSFEVRISGPRLIGMTCLCAADMPGPARLGAASTAWRLIDEQIARLWMIGDYPRAIFPEFMRQRRELVERIPASGRDLWLLPALIRFEPLMSEMAGRPSRAERLIPDLRDPDRHTSLLDFFSDLRTGISIEAGDAPVHGLKLGRILRVAIESAVRGVSDGSVDSMAYATERLFDALLLLENSLSAQMPGALSMEEDKAWFADTVGLAESDGLSSDAIDRTRTFCARMADFCSSAETQAALMREKRNR